VTRELEEHWRKASSVIADPDIVRAYNAVRVAADRFPKDEDEDRALMYGREAGEQHNQLCANARVTKRTITAPDHEMRVAGLRGVTPPPRENGQNSPAPSGSACAHSRLGLHPMQPVTCDDARQVRGRQESFGPGTGPTHSAPHDRCALAAGSNVVRISVTEVFPTF
jgi:hypothetical protein